MKLNPFDRNPTRIAILLLAALSLGKAPVAAQSIAPESPSWLFPDGFGGLTPVSQRVSATSPLSVPSGHNLYITQIPDFSHTCAKFPACGLTATGGSDLLFNGQFSNPLIVGPGGIVASTASIHTFDILGFFVPATVTALVRDIGPGGSYTVPPGQNLFLLNIGTRQPVPGALGLSVGGVSINRFTNPLPLIIGSGQTITNSGTTTVTLDGYFKGA